jgi:hypothetical protein
MFGSLVANGYGAASAFDPVNALYKDDFPALGKPTRPKRSMRGVRLSVPNYLSRFEHLLAVIVTMQTVLII